MFAYRVAQLGGVLMIAGGIVDMSIRELLPHHAALLSASGSVPAESAALVLALLRALGGALIAAGLAVLVLLRFGMRNGHRLAYVAAGATAVLAEAPNAAGMWSTGSRLFIAPLTFMLLVVTGSAVCFASFGVKDQRGSDKAGDVPGAGRKEEP